MLAFPKDRVQKRLPRLQRYMSPLAGCLLAICLLAGVGCLDKMRDRKHAVLLTRSDIDHYAAVAIESPSADERRSAVGRLGESKQVSTPHVIDTLANVATTDTSPSVRSAALLALDRSASPRSCEVAIEILQDSGSEKMLPKEAMTRSAALQTIQRCVETNRVPLTDLSVVATHARRLLEQDRSRHVRLESARVLGYFPQRDILDALVAALHQKDFGICYEAEGSLHLLTGESFDCDPIAWESFLSGPANPFANAPDRRQPETQSKRGWFKWPS